MSVQPVALLLAMLVAAGYVGEEAREREVACVGCLHGDFVPPRNNPVGAKVCGSLKSFITAVSSLGLTC